MGPGAVGTSCVWRGNAAGQLQAGDLIGAKYEVQEVLGRGGNAVTYKVGAPKRLVLADLRQACGLLTAARAAGCARQASPPSHYPAPAPPTTPPAHPAVQGRHGRRA